MKSLAKNRNKETPKPFGTLYHFSMQKSHGSALISPRAYTKKQHVTQAVGAGLTSVAMALYIYSYGPITKSQIVAPVSNDTQPSEIVRGKVTEVSAADALATPIPDKSFSVYIPFLKTKSEIVTNVDPFNEKEYSDALTKGVAQAKGTGLPGQGKRIFLFAHSTNSILNIDRYNAIFYDLGKVPNGEVIELYYEGKVHQYRVTDQKIVSASDVSWLAPRDGEELILQTCYPPGTNWKRLLLFAQKI